MPRSIQGRIDNIAAPVIPDMVGRLCQATYFEAQTTDFSTDVPIAQEQKIPVHEVIVM
jgi:hypothetical protein